MLYVASLLKRTSGTCNFYFSALFHHILRLYFVQQYPAEFISVVCFNKIIPGAAIIKHQYMNMPCDTRLFQKKKKKNTVPSASLLFYIVQMELALVPRCSHVCPP